MYLYHHVIYSGYVIAQRFTATPVKGLSEFRAVAAQVRSLLASLPLLFLSLLLPRVS